MPKIKISRGSIGDDLYIYQASLWGNDGETRSVGAVKVEHGYGITREEAIADFITENIPDLIDTIFIGVEKYHEEQSPKKDVGSKSPKKEKLVEKSKKSQNKLQGRHTKA
jgi:hypothetical protein